MMILTDDDFDGGAGENERRLCICDEIETLICDVAEAHPGLNFYALAMFLPEPQQSRLRALLEEARDFIPYPVEVQP